MVDETVGIKVTADAAGVEAGAAESNAAIKSISATVDGLKDLFLELGGVAKGSLREMSMGAHEAATSVKGAAESVTILREAVSGIGEALIAMFAVEQISEFARKMAEAAEKTLHTAETFGLTAGEVQHMSAQAALAGVPLDVLSNAMQRLDRSFAVAKEGGKSQSAAFKEIGVSVQGSYTQTQLLNTALEGLGHLDAGPAKVAAAMAIFGRNIQGLGPLLAMTDEQLKESEELIDHYGAVNEEAAAKGGALAEAFNQNHVAMMGLNNVLTDAFAPVLKVVVDGMNDLVAAFVKSYNEGGLVRGVLDGLALAFKAIEQAWATVELSIATGWHLISGIVVAWFDALGAVANQVKEFLAPQIANLEDVAAPVFKALAAGWDWITGKLKEFGEWLAKIASAFGTWLTELPFVGAGFAKFGSDMHDTFSKMQTDFENFGKASDKIWNGKGVALPKAGSGTTTDDPNKDGNNKGLDLAEILGPIRDFQAELIAGMHKDYLDSLQDGLRQSVGMYQRDAEARVALDKAAVSQIEQNAKGGVISHAAANEQIKALYTDEMDTKIAAANEEYNTTKTTVDESLKWVAIGTSEYERLQREEVEAKVRRDKAILEAQTANTVALIANDNTETQRLRQQWQGIISPIVSAWGSGLKGMIEGTQSFGQAMAHIGESILDVFLKVGERMVENWLVNLLVVKTASRATALGELSHNAVVAAGAAYASTAAIPIIGPFLAPLAGAAAFTAVMAFGELASAQGGFDIPAGVNPLVQTHAEEMILPASIANPLRDMLAQNDNAAPGGGFYGTDARGGGDAHLHLHGNIIDGPSVGRWFDQNKHHVLGAVNSATRAGGTLKTG